MQEIVGSSPTMTKGSSTMTNSVILGLDPGIFYKEQLMDEVSEGLKSAGSSFWEQTSSFLTWIKGFLTWENLFKLVGALIIIFIFWIVFRLMVRGIKKVPERKLPKARSLILIKFLRPGRGTHPLHLRYSLCTGRP